jgi:ABC-type multidrug transport system permease subunit
VFYLQHQAKYYRAFAYWLSIWAIELPLSFIELIIFVMIQYPLTGLQGSYFGAQFWYFFLVVYALCFATKSLAMFYASVIPSASTAQAVHPVTLVIFFYFSGFLVHKDSIPNPWIWAYYISPFAVSVFTSSF